MTKTHRPSRAEIAAAKQHFALFCERQEARLINRLTAIARQRTRRRFDQLRLVTQTEAITLERRGWTYGGSAMRRRRGDEDELDDGAD